MKNETNPPQPDACILVAGAGGFIGGALVSYFRARGRRRIRAVDIKPMAGWQQRWPDVECVVADLREEAACRAACEDAVEVYNLAADMGGMGFIETERVACLRNILINTHLIEHAQRAGARRYFFASSACVYNTRLQQDPAVRALTESDAYPALPERGYGWEKLMSELFCQEYWAERGLRTFVARLHNVYGPHGTWTGGREKAPAAICRKVIEAKAHGDAGIEIWGDGRQTRSFMYIDDCVSGIDRITHTDALTATPVNLGSSELVSINQLVDYAEEIAGIRLERRYLPDAPRGVMGRNSDNTRLRAALGWEPATPLRTGLARTYAWIETQVAGKATARRRE